MNNFDFTGYMRNIAINLKDIGHIEDDDSNKRFYRISGLDKMQEVVDNFSNLPQFVMIIEDNAEGGMVNNNGLFDKTLCSFFLMKKAELNDADDREDIKNDCISAMRKILSRIRRDYYSDNVGDTDLGIRNVDFNSWQYSTFGPILNTCYGIHIVFTTGNSINTEYDGADWND
jgi:hypothetical protein